MFKMIMSMPNIITMSDIDNEKMIILTPKKFSNPFSYSQSFLKLVGVRMIQIKLGTIFSPDKNIKPPT